MPDSPPKSTGIFAAFEWMIALRYLRAKRRESVISVISVFSLLGIMIGVAALIIVMSVMNGFRAELFEKVTGLNGHAVVTGMNGRLEDWCSAVGLRSTSTERAFLSKVAALSVTFSTILPGSGLSV